jgi:hypothetical protein
MRWLLAALVLFAALDTSCTTTRKPAPAPAPTPRQLVERGNQLVKANPPDPVAAAELYRLAAAAGEPEAQGNLGWMYANGIGVPVE